MRLNKYLAHSGVASRRKCDQLIESGKVIINGVLMKNYSYNVSSNDIVVCDGAIIDTIPNRKVFIVNKLKGYISTSSDTHGRKKVIDLINSTDRLFTVGRLDRDTTGAILVTNDGELANILMHPRNQIKRVYSVATKIDVPKSKYKSLQEGVHLDARTIAYGKIQRLGAQDRLFHWRVILCEGKKHEVKRIFKVLGSAVTHLHRESFAGINVDHLSPGEYRALNKNEINQLSALNKLDI